MSAIPLALTAGVIGALVEYPLGNAFPLEKPVPIVNRMLVAGALVAGSVLIAMHLRKGASERKAQASLDEMEGLIAATRSELAQNNCKVALSNAGKAAVAAGTIESVLSRTSLAFQSRFESANSARMSSRDELADVCFK